MYNLRECMMILLKRHLSVYSYSNNQENYEEMVSVLTVGKTERILENTSSHRNGLINRF